MKRMMVIQMMMPAIQRMSTIQRNDTSIAIPSALRTRKRTFEHRRVARVTSPLVGCQEGVKTIQRAANNKACL